MNSNFINGLVKGMIYYAVGFIAVRAVFAISGWNYGPAPGLHHIIGFLFLLGGAIWSLYYLLWILRGLRSKVNFGILTIHLLALLLFFLFYIF